MKLSELIKGGNVSIQLCVLDQTVHYPNTARIKMLNLAPVIGQNYSSLKNYETVADYFCLSIKRLLRS